MNKISFFFTKVWSAIKRAFTPTLIEVEKNMESVVDSEHQLVVRPPCIQCQEFIVGQGPVPDNKSLVHLANSAPKEKRKRLPGNVKTRDYKEKYGHGKIDWKESFSTLLDQLELTFDNFKMPRDKQSWLSKEEVTAMKKLGVYVPNPWLLKVVEDDSKLRLDVSRPLPAIMSLSFGNFETSFEEGEYPSDSVHPRIMYGIKCKELPFYAHKRKGVPYKFGLAFPYKKKLFWMCMWIVVDPITGEFELCDELRTIEQAIPCMTAASRRAANGRVRYISSRRWADPRMLLIDKDHPRQRMRNVIRNMFCDLVDAWSQRDKRWSVGIRKDGERITIGIESALTSVYFADRDKSARTESGQTKRIIHMVREFTKANGTVVKAHIRGLREFDWKGYQCVVTAPTYNGATTATFAIPTQDIDIEDEDSMHETMPIHKAADAMGKWEDGKVVSI